MAKHNEIPLTASIVTDVRKIKLLEGKRKSIVYRQVLEQIKALKDGGAVLVDIPKSVTIRVMHNRLNGALNRYDLASIAPSKDHVLSRRTSEDGTKIVLLWAKKPAK